MYGLEKIIDLLETKNVPKDWEKELNWNSLLYISISMSIMDIFCSDLLIPRGKPFKTPHARHFNRIKSLIKCIPELYQILDFQKNKIYFTGDADFIAIYLWVKENSPRPRLL